VSVAFGSVVNGLFQEDLRGWKAAWPILIADGTATFRDDQTPHVFLFQAVSVTAATVTISFDFRNALSSASTPESFRDSFYASVFEVADSSQFITEHDKFAVSHGLMDLDAGGPFDVQGSVTGIPEREGWFRFSGTVSISQPYAILLFELYDLNLQAGDSEVRIDNVSVQQP